MNKDVLNTINQEFINYNLKSSLTKLLLKKHTLISVDIKLLIEQIEAKKRCEKKLPTWFNCKNIYYPNKLNIEQTSSEITAHYKSGLVKGKSLIDLTGGFGVDTYYFSKVFQNVTHCEVDENLSQIVAHNYKQLNINKIKTVASDGISYLKNSKNAYDCIYVDPSRRHDSKGKVFFLKDCIPNVPEYLDELLTRANTILLKASPMLDVSIALTELKHVKTIHIVAVNNEVKELLFLIEKNFEDSHSFNCVNIKTKQIDAFHFTAEQELETVLALGNVQDYLYEPNSAILKAGAFKSVAKDFNVTKLHKHSHLYTSNKKIDFPGRRFKVLEVLPYNRKLIKQSITSKQANLTVRNFPETVAQLRQKFKVKDGGNLYVFFTTNPESKKIVILTEKV